MKAVILAGGHGTRLRPLTYTRPKPMIQIVGKPIIEHIVEYLKSFGLFDIILTTNYLKENIIAHLGYGEKFGVNILYPFEEDPLGTAGSVKNIQHLLNETFLVIQGDNITDFDLNGLIKFHRSKGGLATIAVRPVPDPEHYGVVVSNEDGRVHLFQEKPSAQECRSDMINTGVYVVEPQVFDYIPPNTKFDFSRDLFPLLCREGMLYAWPAEGFWTDVGQLKGLNEAKNFLLEGVEYKISDSSTVLGEVSDKVLLGENVYIGRGSVVNGPTVIAPNTVIEDSCVIGPKTCIEKNLLIKEGTAIYGSTLFSGTEVGRQSVLTDTLIAENCFIGFHSNIRQNSIVGSNCELGLSVHVAEGARIWPNMRITRDSTVSGDLRIFWQTQDLKYSPQWSLRDLSVDEAFYFNKKESSNITHTGYVARNLLQFNDILSKVELNSIKFHFRHNINDFSEWARRIICDPILSQLFDRVKVNSGEHYAESTRKSLLTETTKRLNELKSVL